METPTLNALGRCKLQFRLFDDVKIDSVESFL